MFLTGYIAQCKYLCVMVMKPNKYDDDDDDGPNLLLKNLKIVNLNFLLCNFKRYVHILRMNEIYYNIKSIKIM